MSKRRPSNESGGGRDDPPPPPGILLTAPPDSPSGGPSSSTQGSTPNPSTQPPSKVPQGGATTPSNKIPPGETSTPNSRGRSRSPHSPIPAGKRRLSTTSNQSDPPTAPNSRRGSSARSKKRLSIVQIDERPRSPGRSSTGSIFKGLGKGAVEGDAGGGAKGRAMSLGALMGGGKNKLWNNLKLKSQLQLVTTTSRYYYTAYIGPIIMWVLITCFHTDRALYTFYCLVISLIIQSIPLTFSHSNLLNSYQNNKLIWSDFLPISCHKPLTFGLFDQLN